VETEVVVDEANLGQEVRIEKGAVPHQDDDLHPPEDDPHLQEEDLLLLQPINDHDLQDGLQNDLLLLPLPEGTLVAVHEDPLIGRCIVVEVVARVVVDEVVVPDTTTTADRFSETILTRRNSIYSG